MFRDTELKNTDSWKQDLDNLARFKREIESTSEQVPLMGDYLLRRMRQKIEQMSPKIKQGAIAEFKQAIKSYQAAEQKKAAARKGEASRWDIVKLDAEKQAIKNMVADIARSSSPLENGDKLDHLQALYNDLMAGDITRQRAAAEVFGNLTEMRWEGETKNGEPLRYRVGELAQAAREVEPALRGSTDLTVAESQIESARDELLAAHQQLLEVGRELNDDPSGIFAAGEMARAFKMVRWNPDGTVNQIHGESDPEVTGVDLSRLRGE